MTGWARFRTFLRDSFGRGRMERDMDAELCHHVASYTDDLIRRGLPREQAERQARIEFGQFEPLKEECRQARGLRFLDETNQDLRYAARLLRKSPGFTAIAVLTLALGIGLNTSIFSVVNAWILKSVPYPNPDQLVVIQEVDPKKTAVGVVSPGDVSDWRKAPRVFDEICAYSTPIFTLLNDDQPEQFYGARVNWEFFHMLGVTPHLGRDFLPQEDAPDAPPVAIISHELWQSRFEQDPALVGKTIPIDGQKVPVVGILPVGFHLPLLGRAAIFMPLALTAAERPDRRVRYLNVIARMRPGVSLPQAFEYMNTVARRLEKDYPVTNTGRAVRLHTLQDEIGKEVGTDQVLIVFWLVGCVLLIACGNVANLVVGRAVNRQREMAVRLAIGAGRGRLLRQLLIENLVLFLVAAAASVVFAIWGVHWIAETIPADIRQYLPGSGALRVDRDALFYTLGIALASGVIFGFAPAFRCWALEVNEGLKRSTARVSGSGAGNRIKNCLIVFEVALALIVLVTAALLAKGLMRMYTSEPGFQPKGLMVAQIALSGSRYADPKRVEAFYTGVLDEIRRLPGVKAASAGMLVPFADVGNYTGYAVDGRSRPAPGNVPSTRLDMVAPGYFSTMGIALLRGRAISEYDQADSPRVAVINQELARREFGGEDPVGKRLRLGAGFANVVTVVGVVGDSKGQNETDLIEPQLYLPYRQSPSRNMRIVLRMNSETQDMASALRRAVMAVDKGQAVAGVQSMQKMMAQERSPQIIVSQITIFFALLSLFLAALGIYGVMAYSVAARRREFGIRLALGAAGSDLASLVVGQGLKLALIGLAIGLAAAFGVTRLMKSILYQVSPTDSATFVSISILLLVVALLACYVPARRASTVDPTRALRYE